MEFNLTNADWNKLQIDDKKFSFKSFFDTQSLELLICDIHEFKLYILKQERQEIFNIFEALNPRLEAPLSKILSLLHDSLCKKDSTAQFSLNPLFSNEQTLKVQMKTKIVGVNFHYKFDLDLLESHLARDYFLAPLLYGNAEHQSREAEFIKIIQNKDKELEDYKSQGVKLTRSYLKTDPFNASKFDETVANKTQPNAEMLENPGSCLHTPLSHTVHRACMKKYYSTLKDSNDTIILSKSQSSDNSELHNCSLANEPEDFVVKSSDSETIKKVNIESDRLKVLETKLNDEKTKSTSRTPKKKKLF